jgi:hypothetical protein
MLRTLAAIALLTAALALPGSALAVNGPTGGTSASTQTSTAPVNLLRDGKYLPTPTAAPTTVEVVRVVKPAGFDYRDAGIGAAVGALVIALVGGVVILTSHNGSATRVAGTRVG